jgi:hypothetical protein
MAWGIACGPKSHRNEPGRSLQDDGSALQLAELTGKESDPDLCELGWIALVREPGPQRVIQDRDIPIGLSCP